MLLGEARPLDRTGAWGEAPSNGVPLC
ncbi:hypothetical protein MTBLM1_40045 [Rhodospirillaceae bacterium LM-1]|nr:hypothetical protein MTBLM1_40045 [Rhodospirillaceae bacterium LM-1]